MRIKAAGQELELLPERAVWWAERHTLIFSDVHLGKAQSYRFEGIAIPSESGLTDLDTIASLIERWRPKEILILGDFIHHRQSWTPKFHEDLGIFLAQNRNIEWKLILGNHERGSRENFEDLPVELVAGDVLQAPFRFAHGHEVQTSNDFTVSGHVHPIVVLKEGPLTMRCPCFVLSPSRLLLPSFGVWTGGVEVSKLKDQRIFAVAGQEVFEVETPKSRRQAPARER